MTEETKRIDNIVETLQTAALVLDARAASWQDHPSGARVAVRNPAYDAHAALLRSLAARITEYREAWDAGESYTYNEMVQIWATSEALLSLARGETPNNPNQQEGTE